jgi:putative MFS transporter
LLIAKGIKVATSLEYSFIIAIANPVGPLLCTLIADRIERKWQVCLGAVGIGVFAMLFANSEVPAMLILLGVLVTLCNNLLSYSCHCYQSDLFPTRIRSRAIGFCLFLEPVVGCTLRPRRGVSASIWEALTQCSASSPSQWRSS